MPQPSVLPSFSRDLLSMDVTRSETAQYTHVWQPLGILPSHHVMLIFVISTRMETMEPSPVQANASLSAEANLVELLRIISTNPDGQPSTDEYTPESLNLMLVSTIRSLKT